MKLPKHTDQRIQEEFVKIPERLRDNFLVRAAVNSVEELGVDGVLDQLKDIIKYAGHTSEAKSIGFAELSTGLVPFVRAGKKSHHMPKSKRKAK